MLLDLLLLLSSLHRSGCPSCRDAIEHEAGIYPVLFGDGGAFLRKVVGQAVDSTFGEVFAAEFASLGVPADKIISRWTLSVKLQGPWVRDPKW